MPGAVSAGDRYAALGHYSDWVAQAVGATRPGWWPGSGTRAPEEVRAQVLAVLGGSPGEELPGAPRVEEAWEEGELLGERVSWSVGFGPRTEAYLLRPREPRGPLPAVLALHCHGGFKYYGKEKVADGPTGAPGPVAAVREQLYSGRAYANALARRGFVVLAHDVFTWGSRRFELETPAAGEGTGLEEDEVISYNAAAGAHEHVVEKYCRLLGTTLAAVIAREDRIALSYLASRPEVEPTALGCVGCSGGGLRAGLLRATSERCAAAVVVAMMTTYEGLLDHNVAGHTWMLYPGQWPVLGDWPDLVGCRPGSPLLVQYDRGDRLFSPEGMAAADRRLGEIYARAGNPGGYLGQFYEGPHKFDREMQEAAFAWLADALAR